MSARQTEPHEAERVLRDEPPTLARLDDRAEATDEAVREAIPEVDQPEATDAEVREAIEAAEDGGESER